MSDEPLTRIRQLRSTLSAIRRVHPRNHPSVDEIARFHELHARHERDEGREDRAVAAEERARRIREHGH
jgi:hypothetical protein